MMKKRILIIGNNSPVAQAIGDRLRTDYQVVFAGKSGVFDVHFDIRDADISGFQGEKFEAVINLATSYPKPDNSNISEIETVNALGSLLAAQIARMCDAQHYIYFSSVSAAYNENSAYYNAYSLSKRHGEDLALLFCRQNNMKLTILRPSQIYDRDSLMAEKQKLFYSIINQSRISEDILIYGSNDAIRNVIFLEDLAHITHLTVVEKIVGTYNCISQEDVRLSDIAQAAISAFGTSSKLVFDSNKPDIPNISIDKSIPTFKHPEYKETPLLKGLMHIAEQRQSS